MDGSGDVVCLFLVVQKACKILKQARAPRWKCYAFGCKTIWQVMTEEQFMRKNGVMQSSIVIQCRLVFSSKLWMIEECIY